MTKLLTYLLFLFDNQALTLDQAFDITGRSFVYPVDYLRAVCWVESHHNPKAYNHADGGSGNSAIGLCQILPSTAEWLGFDAEGCKKDFRKQETRDPKTCLLFNPVFNMTVAATYLSWQFERYDGNLRKATLAYNTGSVRICKKDQKIVKPNGIVLECKGGEYWNNQYLERVLKAKGENR